MQRFPAMGCTTWMRMRRSECAKLVGAKHNIPVHEVPIDSADATVAEYDEAKLEAFQAPGRIILVPGAELHL